jgi:hypothetical protein
MGSRFGAPGWIVQLLQVWSGVDSMTSIAAGSRGSHVGQPVWHVVGGWPAAVTMPPHGRMSSHPGCGDGGPDRGFGGTSTVPFHDVGHGLHVKHSSTALYVQG